MAYTKQNWVNGETLATAERMNHIEDGIANSLTSDNIKTEQTNSDNDTYSCNYINNKVGYNISTTPTKVGYKINSNYDHTKIHYQNNNFDETLEINERTREEARILYVAMTRAIRNFSWICLDSSSNESWQKRIREEK